MRNETGSGPLCELMVKARPPTPELRVSFHVGAIDVAVLFLFGSLLWLRLSHFYHEAAFYILLGAGGVAYFILRNAFLDGAEGIPHPEEKTNIDASDCETSCSVGENQNDRFSQIGEECESNAPAKPARYAVIDAFTHPIGYEPTVPTNESTPISSEIMDANRSGFASCRADPVAAASFSPILNERSPRASSEIGEAQRVLMAKKVVPAIEVPVRVIEQEQSLWKNVFQIPPPQKGRIKSIERTRINSIVAPQRRDVLPYMPDAVDRSDGPVYASSVFDEQPAGLENVPDDLILRVGFFLPLDAFPLKETFLQRLANIALQKAKKPIFIHPVLIRATPIAENYAQEWIRGCQASAVDCLFVLLPPNIAPQFLERTVERARQAGLACFLVSPSQIDSRLLYIDLIMQLTLLREKKAAGRKNLTSADDAFEWRG